MKKSRQIPKSSDPDIEDPLPGIPSAALDVREKLLAAWHQAWKKRKKHFLETLD